MLFLPEPDRRESDGGTLGPYRVYYLADEFGFGYRPHFQIATRRRHTEKSFQRNLIAYPIELGQLSVALR